MTITVTQEHIDKASEPLCSWCPIELALHDLGFKHPGVSKHNAVPRAGLIARLPDVAMQFVQAFDDGADVQPFSFDLDVRP